MNEIKFTIIIYIVLFLSIFVYRNLSTIKKTGKKNIISRSPVVIAASLSSLLVYLMAYLSAVSLNLYLHFIPLHMLLSNVTLNLGIFGLYFSLAFGFLASSNLGKSWRVGIVKDSESELVTTGIYSYSRNPYFLSYYISFFSMILITPSVAITVVSLIAIIFFHMMIRREEKFLLGVHGEKYRKYMEKVPRYLIF